MALHRPPVAADASGADTDAELTEFALDAHAAPARVVAGHPLDQLSHLRRDPRSAWGAATPPRPVMSPRRSMPAHDRIRLDDEKGRAPAGPAAREPAPEQAVCRPKVRTPGRASHDRELMAQSQVFEGHVLSGSQRAADGGEEQRDVDVHWPNPPCSRRYVRAGRQSTTRVLRYGLVLPSHKLGRVHRVHR